MNENLKYYNPQSVNDAISKEIGEITIGVTRPFLTDKFSLHELFSYVLDAVGPAHIFMSSYSISEEAIRTLILEHSDGRIKSMQAVFDFSTRKNKLPQLMFADSITSIRLTENHSKVIVFAGESFGAVYVGSANFNRNKRFEGGFVTSDPELYNFFFNKYKSLYDNAMPFDLINIQPTINNQQSAINNQQ